MSILWDASFDGEQLRLQVEQTLSADPNRAFTTREVHELVLPTSQHYTYKRVYRALFHMWTAEQKLLTTRNSSHRYWMWRGHAQLADGRVVRA